METVWKKTLSLLLCLMLLTGLFPAALAEGEMYTLVFYTDGGDSLEPITAEQGTEITLPKTVWDNHCFLGWSAENDGTADYHAGDPLVLTEDLYLYAIWLVGESLGPDASVEDSRGTDSGLWAYAAGSGTDYEKVTVPMGESATLRVAAGVNVGELHSRWVTRGIEGTETLAEDTLIFVVDTVESCWPYICQVSDDYGNTVYVHFEVGPYTGLWARVAGKTDTYAEITVDFGERATLSVEAGVNMGGLHYWWASTNLDPSLLPMDDSTTSITIPSIERQCHVYCRVMDDYGNAEYVDFDIFTDTGLKARVAGTETQYMKYTVQKGGSVTLAVEASVNEGGLRYCWESDKVFQSQLPQDETTPSFILENVSSPGNIRCTVYDDWDNYQIIMFRLLTDTGLTAYVAGTQTNYMEYKVPFGDSVTLAVDARVNEGGIHYLWDCDGERPAELPTDDSTPSFTISDVQRAYNIYCIVRDDYGDECYVGFDVYPDTGLKAWIEGNDPESNYRSYEVPLGDSLTLTVKAETNGGNLHYNWYCYTGDVPDLPTDDQTSSFTIAEVKGAAFICCEVSDDYGAKVYLYMSISVDNDLKAFAAGTELAQVYYFDSSAPQTLAVDASANEGELTYQWRRQMPGENPIALSDGPTLYVGAVTEVCDYLCEVTDIYGSLRVVFFSFRQGMVKELTLGTETAIESDPNLREILVSFTPETSGQYTLKTAADDPHAWCFAQHLGVYPDLPAPFTLEAGTTYYFVIYTEGTSVTLHLTMEKAPGFRNFEELQALLQQSLAGEQLTYEGSDDPFVIPESISIPAGVEVIFNDTGVEIAQGAQLTLEENAVMLCGKLTVNGGLQNNGKVICGGLFGQGQIQHGERGMTSLQYAVKTEEELCCTVEQSAANTDAHIIYEIITVGDLTITRDLTLSSGTHFYIGNTVTVAPGVTLEIRDPGKADLQVFGQGQLRVQGTLLNDGLIFLFQAPGLVLDGGRYTGSGLIQAQASGGKARDYFPWAFQEEYSDYEIMADGDWYFLSKKVVAEPGDVNGDGSINSKDLLLLRKILIGLPADDKIVAPDVNGDTHVDLLDLVRLRKLLAAMEAG